MGAPISLLSRVHSASVRRKGRTASQGSWAEPGTAAAGRPPQDAGSSPIAARDGAADGGRAGRALVRPGPAVSVHGSPPMVDLFRNLLPASDEEGQGLAEYALILALIAVVANIALIFLGNQISGILNDVAGNI